jgi:hypothetical protein
MKFNVYGIFEIKKIILAPFANFEVKRRRNGSKKVKNLFVTMS